MSVSRARFVLSAVLSIDVCQPREIVHARFFSAHVNNYIRRRRKTRHFSKYNRCAPRRRIVAGRLTRRFSSFV